MNKNIITNFAKVEKGGGVRCLSTKSGYFSIFTRPGCCVNFFLTGVNFVLQTYGVLSYIVFVSFLHSFCVKIQANEGKK